MSANVLQENIDHDREASNSLQSVVDRMNITPVDPVAKNLDKLVKKPPMLQYRALADTSAVASFGANGVTYTIGDPTGFYFGRDSALQVILTPTTVTTPPDGGAMYIDKYGLALIKGLRTKMGNETLIDVSKCGLYMLQQLETNIKIKALKASLVADGRPAASRITDLSRSTSLTIPLPSVFDSVRNILRTRRLAQSARPKIEIDYETLANLVCYSTGTISAPGTISSAVMRLNTMASNSRYTEGRCEMDSTPQTMYINRFIGQDFASTIGVGAVNFSQNITINDSAALVLFYVSDDTAQGAQRTDFVGVPLTSHTMLIDGKAFPQNAESADYSNYCLSQALGTTFDTNIYGYCFGIERPAEEPAISFSVLKNGGLSSVTISGTFATPGTATRSLHVLVQYKSFASVGTDMKLINTI